MKTIKSFAWIFKILNEVLTIDNNYQILLCGPEIKKTIFSGKDEIKPNFFENFKTKKEKDLIKNTVDSVWKNHEADLIHLESVNKQLFFFPVGENSDRQMIISTNEQIIHTSKVEMDLEERVKELECLYSVSSVFESPENIELAIQRSVPRIRSGLQFPEKSAVSIVFDKRHYGDKECTEIKSFLKKDIVVNDKTRGRIQVCSDKKFQFLEEESKLIREIAIIMAKAIEKNDRTRAIEHQRKLLLKKNEKLLELTTQCGESKNRLETLFNAITDTILVIDKKYNIEMSNKDDVKDSEKCYEKIFNIDNPCENCPGNMTFKSKQATTNEIEYAGKYYLLQAYPIFNDKGEVDKVLEISRDITKEKEIELQLLQTDKLASLGKLVSGIAHEINNPNTFIMGNIKIIKESFDDLIPILDELYKTKKDLKIARLNYEIFKENIPSLIDDMLGGANRIKKIVDDLRNFAKKDEGLLTDKVDINEVINNSLRLVENQIKRNSEIELSLQSELPKIKGNIQKLEQVMVNLLLNAAQAIENKKGIIQINTEISQHEKMINIKIIDDGKGISDDTMKAIFDPFFTTKRDQGGTGLGLSIAYGIIQEHNGNIEVESKLGLGSTFKISLPVSTEGS
jgi:signal transduction histidine kinase